MSGEAAGSAAFEMGRRPEGSFDLASMVTAFRWQVDAACKGVGCGDFFAEREEGQSSHGHEAKALCAVCPVIEECLVYSLENREAHGIWAGAGEGRRRVLVRAWKRKEEEPDQWERIRDDHLARVRLFALPTQAREAALAAMGAAPMVGGRGINATGQSHGRRSTYNRGCRCVACRWTLGSHVKLLRRLEVDTAALWVDAAPEGWDELPAEEVLEAVNRATVRYLVRPDVLVDARVYAWADRLIRGRGTPPSLRRIRVLLLEALAGDNLEDRLVEVGPAEGGGLSEAA